MKQKHIENSPHLGKSAAIHNSKIHKEKTYPYLNLMTLCRSLSKRFRVEMEAILHTKAPTQVLLIVFDMRWIVNI